MMSIRGAGCFSLASRAWGKTGLDIFYRRVQPSWDEVLSRLSIGATLASLAKLGLPEDAEGLKTLVQGKLGVVEGGGGFEQDANGNEEMQRRRVFGQDS